MDSVKCRNCGNYGHKLRNCKFPRLSYGIVLFNDKNEIVMIEKHDSISYIEFIRGKYKLEDKNYIQLLIDRMSEPEKQKIQNYTFNQLWNDIWYSEENTKEYHKSNKKYDEIKDNLKYYVDKSNKNYKYNEWEIPKGRRNLNETDKECAIREFKEETDIDEESYEIYENILPFHEKYTGSNNIEYKNVYFIASLKKDISLNINKNNKDQLNEIKSIKWISKDNYKEYVREYSDYKLSILNNIFFFLESNYSDQIIK